VELLGQLDPLELWVQLDQRVPQELLEILEWARLDLSVLLDHPVRKAVSLDQPDLQDQPGQPY
jgi:hypothetical protein